MIASELICQWGIWFIYQGESYDGNVQLITTLGSWADLAYFWLHSPIASLNNYFLTEQNRQKTYLIGDNYRKINSIEIFRKGIEPKWEDERNQKGGRFIFQVPKTQTNQRDIYQQLTFFFLGEHFEGSEKVNGFRFVTTKVNNPSCYRIEIWVDFDESDTEALTAYQDILTNLFRELKFELRERIQFKQMRGEGAPKAEPKGEARGETKGEAKGEPKSDVK